MTIIHVSSLSQLNKLLSRKDKATVVDFHASWCGPCHMIAPTFDALSKRYSNVNFCKVDVDSAQEISSHYRVKAMPTFIFLSGSMEVERISGADREKLEAAVAKLAGSSTASSFTGTGHTLGGSSTSTASPKSTAAHPAVLRFSGPDAGLDPQLKVLLALVAAYLSFWYLSS